jgi:acyl-CoA thioesterase I
MQSMNLPVRAMLVVLLAALLVLGAGCGRKPQYSAIPPGSSVLAMGDSVTFGTGSEKDKDYPAQLAQRSGWTIHNYGIPGDTSAGVKERIEEALTESSPALVLLEIGGNDFLRRTSNAEVKENIRAIVKLIKSHGIPVVLIAVPQFSPLGAALGHLPDAPLYEELAKEESIPLIPEVFADVLSDTRLKSDQIHPNSDGYQQMAEGIARALTQTGFLKAR